MNRKTNNEIGFSGNYSSRFPHYSSGDARSSDPYYPYTSAYDLRLAPISESKYDSSIQPNGESIIIPSYYHPASTIPSETLLSASKKAGNSSPSPSSSSSSSSAANPGAYQDISRDFSNLLKLDQSSKKDKNGVWNFTPPTSTIVSTATEPAYFKLSRLLRFFNIRRNTDSLLFIDLCKTFGDVFTISSAKIETMGYAYIAYYDLRDAVKAYNGFPQLKLPGYGSIQVEYVQPSEFERISINSNSDELSLCWRSKVLINTTHCYESIYHQLKKFGEIRIIERISSALPSNIDSCSVYVCDFYDIRVASAVVDLYGSSSSNTTNQSLMFNVSFICNGRSANYDDAPVNNNTLHSSFSGSSNSTSVSSLKSQKNSSTNQSSVNNSSTELMHSHEEGDCELMQEQQRMERYVDKITEIPTKKPICFKSSLTKEPICFKSSLTDPNTNSEDNLRNGSLDYNRQKSAVPFSKSYNDYKLNELSVVTKADVPKNNLVDLRKIAQGLDTRTTLMLRNIPNKVDQKMLKEYIDMTNKNTYDFLCKLKELKTNPNRQKLTFLLDLRIDFANKCK